MKTRTGITLLFACLISLFSLTGTSTTSAADHPNVILVITDDQGYGDIHAHGNEMIQTPALDKLHSESIRLTDFHVDPTCAPTRSALMTGRYSTRVGVWHTIMGRSQLRSDEVTLGDVFSENGYATGMFGKWHLGDNVPYYPWNRGFQETFYNGGGGVTQEPDYWGNDYFDDTYFRNGTPEKTEGYCTDVWFDNAIDFVTRHKDEPFFCYLATNAPHGPLYVADEYWKPYAEKGVPENMARFYGMITNIDENMARLRTELDKLGLTENTILIFMTDNGTASGSSGNPDVEGMDAKGKWQGYTAGMKAKKGSYYDGGHRVPFFIYWPGGGLDVAADVDQITAHVDVLPTLIDLCNLKRPEACLPGDGISIVPLLRFAEASAKGQPCNVLWPDRTLFAEVNREDFPPKWKKNVVMTDQWRLCGPNELYNIVLDPGQENNVIDEHPEIAEQLRAAYEKRWPGLVERCDEYTLSMVGDDRENPTTIYSHDWHPLKGGTGGVPWNQGQVRSMMKANGIWAFEVAQDGKYRFTLRHQPEHAEFPLHAKTARFVLSQKSDLSDPIFDKTIDVTEGMTGAPFEMELKKTAPMYMQSWLTEENGTVRGAYFVDVERLE